MVLVAAFGLQAREIHFWEMRMPRAPCTLKITKARIRLESMHPENWARIAHTVFPLYARNRAADRQKKKHLDANLSPLTKSSEYGETQMLKHMIFPRCIPTILDH